MSYPIAGEKIYVETPLFEGWAIVVGIHSDPRELYPLAIELVDGDSDGHRYKRVGKDDIKKEEIECRTTSVQSDKT
jgi:hypothetical protein